MLWDSYARQEHLELIISIIVLWDSYASSNTRILVDPAIMEMDCMVKCTYEVHMFLADLMSKLIIYNSYDVSCAASPCHLTLNPKFPQLASKSLRTPPKSTHFIDSFFLSRKTCALGLIY